MKPRSHLRPIPPDGVPLWVVVLSLAIGLLVWALTR